jgi:hypothetical protein
MGCPMGRRPPSLGYGGEGLYQRVKHVSPCAGCYFALRGLVCLVSHCGFPAPPALKRIPDLSAKHERRTGGGGQAW